MPNSGCEAMDSSTSRMSSAPHDKFAATTTSRHLGQGKFSLDMYETNSPLVFVNLQLNDFS